MKKWAFVSDFDGTISNKDFYWIIIDKYFPQGKDLFNRWKAGEIMDITFLQTVFSSIHQDEEQILDDILSIPIDEYVPDFIKTVQTNGGDFYILSAGTDYYIYHILKKYGIKNVKVFSNEGFFKEKNVHMKLDAYSPHYSERYGIDKSKVVQELKEEYEQVHFIGDSEPDSYPALFADVTFAKNGLQEMLTEKRIPYIAVNDFHEVETYLVKEGIIS
ncbi:MtnX-like HAD-IB family phosphatase [Neobacillus sp. PS3-34]|uniref:MtnX-like HAD-IB family phosphatase n=1 Tax=Neobacillus sp. PS3-34 TaxID=3070678 RepID=UPI0027E20654|nr:MtnX-like HAD-IB family phosphatase [Neobacillus sp. PS3-34]WML50693.1 MtnX-like HAD-IB family phosphatase [Neobacillus sp. PS3-34]